MSTTTENLKTLAHDFGEAALLKKDASVTGRNAGVLLYASLVVGLLTGRVWGIEQQKAAQKAGKTATFIPFMDKGARISVTQRGVDVRAVKGKEPAGIEFEGGAMATASQIIAAFNSAQAKAKDGVITDGTAITAELGINAVGG